METVWGFSRNENSYLPETVSFFPLTAALYFLDPTVAVKTLVENEDGWFKELLNSTQFYLTEYQSGKVRQSCHLNVKTSDRNDHPES